MIHQTIQASQPLICLQQCALVVSKSFSFWNLFLFGKKKSTFIDTTKKSILWKKENEIYTTGTHFYSHSKFYILSSINELLDQVPSFTCMLILHDLVLYTFKVKSFLKSDNSQGI